MATIGLCNCQLSRGAACMLRWSLGLWISLPLLFTSFPLMRLPLHLGSVSTGYPGSTFLGTWWIVMSADGLGRLEPVCCVFLIPLLLLYYWVLPCGKNVPTRVETGPGARDSTHGKHPGVSHVIHAAVGWAESVSPGLPRWQCTGSPGHCWFLSQL